MRIPKYISPSALKKYMDSPDDYYLQYLADNRPPRTKQTPAMAAGSAFDAFCKSFIHSAIYGPNHDPKYSLQALFEQQVEVQNRDISYRVGDYLFNRYKDYGGLADIILEINKSIAPPKFEVEVMGVIGKSADKNGVPLLGKPDVMFTNEQGAQVIFDWKVNGFYSSSAVSPMACYLNVKDAYNHLEATPSRNSGMHKDCQPLEHRGMMINGGKYFEDLNQEWAIQLSTYAWLLGSFVGEETILAVDQICCDPKKTITHKYSAPIETPEPINTESLHYPSFRIASHRGRASQQFQIKTMQRYQDLWDRVNDRFDVPGYTEKMPWFFRDLSPQDSVKRQSILEAEATVIYGVNGVLSEEDLTFLKLVS